MEILTGQGLPSGYSKEQITRNSKTGHLSVENLDPGECLALSANMNSRRFLSRQIHVTSVVADSPAKSPPASIIPPTQSPMAPPNQSQSPLSASSDLTQADQNRLNNASLKPLPPSLDNLLVPNPGPTAATNANNPSPSGFNNSSTPKSPGVQEKINQIELNAMTPINFKRKSEESPENSELSKKEKKMMREAEKKQRKTLKKEQFRQNRSLDSSL